MPKTKKRTNVKDLPKTKQELTSDQSKRIKGGLANLSPEQQQAQGIRFNEFTIKKTSDR